MATRSGYIALAFQKASASAAVKEMNVSVTALSAFLMRRRRPGGITVPAYGGGIANAAADKGDVLRPLLIQHSSKGLQILYLLSPHNSSRLEANTHTDTDTHEEM